jgi:SOS response regulatory protein OraA/RecX
MEMKQKGLARDVVDQALESLPDEEQTAYTLALSKIRTFQRYDDRDFANKMIGFCSAGDSDTKSHPRLHAE